MLGLIFTSWKTLKKIKPETREIQEKNSTRGKLEKQWKFSTLHQNSYPLFFLR